MILNMKDSTKYSLLLDINDLNKYNIDFHSFLRKFKKNKHIHRKTNRFKISSRKHRNKRYSDYIF